MATGKALNGKPYAGNPHVRFDEGEVASAATPRRGSLLYNLKTVLALAAAICGVVALPSYAIDNPLAADYTLTGDETVAAALTVNADVTLDLAGHTLTVNGLAGSGTITDTSNDTDNPGRLVVNVASGDSQNSTVALSGNLVLVKTGAGRLIATKTGQTYTGGTIVSNGIMRAWMNCYPSDATYGRVTVCEGAVFDVDGSSANNQNYRTASAACLYILDGGTLANRGGNIPAGWSQVAKLQLLRDSYFEATANLGFINGGYGEINLDFGGHTLYLSTASGHTSYLYNFGFTNGKLVLNGPASPNINKGTFRAPNGDLEVNCGVGHSTAVSVSNLTWNAGAFVNNVAYVFSVYGQFTPNGQRFPSIQMQNGSSIDLSGKDAAWSVVSAVNAARTCTFAANAKIKIYVGARDIHFGEKLVSWSEMPSATVDFELVCDGTSAEERGMGLAVANDGIYVKPTTEPAYAMWNVLEGKWNFYLEDGTAYPVEWEGGVTSTMEVRYSSYAEYQYVKTADVTPLAYRLAGSFTMPGDVDSLDLHQAFDGVVSNAVIDVNGKSVTIPSTVFTGNRPFTVTSSAEGGRLLLDVESGTAVNTLMSLTGSLTFVKIGAGKLNAEKTGQTYTGGTIVSNGTMRAWNNCYPSDATYGRVTVCDGAVFDVDGAGSKDAANYGRKNASVTCLYILDGGTLANLGGYIPDGWTMLSRVQLTKDSFINAANDFGFINGGYAAHTLDLDGRKLTVSVGSGKSFFLYNLTVQNGMFVANGAGSLVFNKTTFNGVNASFDVNCGVTVNLANISMGDLTWGANAYAANNANRISVYGELKPVGTKFPNLEMQNGSTLDLSGNTLPWSTTASQDDHKCSFASDARTIYVKIGDRTVSSKTPIVTWDAKPANTVKFKRADEGQSGSLVAKDDGLYLMKGFIIFVK